MITLPRLGGATGEEALGVHQQQAADDGEEAGGVQIEAAGHADGGDQHAADGGTDDAGGVEVGRVEGDGVRQVVAPDEFDDEGLAGGVVEGVGDAEDGGQDVDVQELDAPAGDEDGEDEGLHGHDRFGSRMRKRRFGRRSAITPPKRERQRIGEELDSGDGAEGEGRVGKLEDEPGLGDPLHPGAGERTT